RPPDAARGREIFFAKRCSACHAINGAPSGPGPALPKMPPLEDAVALTERMWSASAAMQDAAGRKRIPWPELTSQQATDLFGLIVAHSPKEPRAGELPLLSAQPGDRLFAQKGCKTCHYGVNSLTGRFSGRTLLDFAVAMWNQAPAMRRRPALLPGEMRQLAGYLWTLQIPQPPGDTGRGRSCFTGKGCASCHEESLSGSPRLTRRRWDPYVLMNLLWRRGPMMQAKLEAARRPWPQLSTTELADLLAYLNRPPTPRSY
ncbi:MAG: c-type cytochrome, partial [Bryobacteraceae bacterium]